MNANGNVNGNSNGNGPKYPKWDLVQLPPLPIPILQKFSNNVLTDKQLLQEAFSSLSLADKCAFAISVRNQFNKNQEKLAKSMLDEEDDAIESSEARDLSMISNENDHSAQFDIFSNGSGSFPLSDGGDVSNPMSNSSSGIMNQAPRRRRGSAASHSDSATDLSDRDQFDMQSVISESDKECLDVVMKMMGHLELTRIEDEVLLYYSISHCAVDK